MASPNLSEIVTTTLRNRSRQLADNVTNHNALLRKMRERGNVVELSGGRDIVRELEYQANDTVNFYSGYEVLDTSPADVLSSAVYDWKQLAGTVTISGLEEIKNSGPEAIINLLEARISVLEKSLENSLSTSLYSDGTGSSGKEVGGLQLVIADAGTGTVGGINSSTFTFWQNVQTTATSSAFSSTNVQADMNNIYLSLVRGVDKPDIVTADANAYKAFLASLQTIQRVADADEAMLVSWPRATSEAMCITTTRCRPTKCISSTPRICVLRLRLTATSCRSIRACLSIRMRWWCRWFGPAILLVPTAPFRA